MTLLAGDIIIINTSRAPSIPDPKTGVPTPSLLLPLATSCTRHDCPNNATNQAKIAAAHGDFAVDVQSTRAEQQASLAGAKAYAKEAPAIKLCLVCLVPPSADGQFATKARKKDPIPASAALCSTRKAAGNKPIQLTSAVCLSSVAGADCWTVMQFQKWAKWPATWHAPVNL